MIFFAITSFIQMFLLLKFAETEKEDINVQLFQKFKNNYGREYSDFKSEQEGFHNFVINLAEVNRLNKEHPGKIIAYQLNRYADLDPEEIEQHFALHIKPYDNMEHENKEAIVREHRHKFLEDLNLYDLDDVEDLYHAWTKKWGKTKFNNTLQKQISYYRFVKTVAEANKKKFAGEDDVSLDEDADQVLEPDKYFYG